MNVENRWFCESLLRGLLTKDWMVQSQWRCSASHCTLFCWRLGRPLLTSSALISRCIHPIVFKTNFSTQKRVPSWRCCKLFHGQRFGNFWLRNKHCKKSVSFLASHAQVDIKAISVETEFLDMEKRFDLKFRNIFNEDISGDVDMHWHLQDYLNHDMMLNWWKE